MSNKSRDIEEQGHTSKGIAGEGPAPPPRRRARVFLLMSTYFTLFGRNADRARRTVLCIVYALFSHITPQLMRVNGHVGERAE